MKTLKYKTSLGSFSIDPWETQFAFFWYNDEEIFSDSEEDLARKAKQLADNGVTHVITFSCTHFRWTFSDYWEQLNETLAKVVRACHRHGILVTEHHSSELSHFIGNEDDLVYLNNILRVRKSKESSWPKMIESAKGDPVLIDNIRRSQMVQIDGSTGTFTPNRYHAYSMCFNNPHYRRAYFRYLESVYATGVDGIMTDDVQWLGGDPHANACGCGHCRHSFTEQTGLVLPDAGEAWTRMIGDYDNPVFLAWLDFRFRSVEAFHIAVKEHYESLGLRLLRPNYCSHVLNSNSSAYALEGLPQLDWVFQESCFSTIIRYSWPSWAVEQGHRQAMGRARGIPSMVMFYPDRPDTTVFCWSLAMSWGAKYLATDEGVLGNETETRLRQFESKHRRLLSAPRSMATLAFYDSRRNREIHEHYDKSTAGWNRSWIQACVFGAISWDLLSETGEEALARYGLIVLPEIAVLSDDEIRSFRLFVERGGVVVWGGASGSRDGNGQVRTKTALAKLLGVEAIPTGGESCHEIELAAGRLIFVSEDFLRMTPLPEVGLMRFEADAASQRVPYEALGEKGQAGFARIADFLKSLLPSGPILAAPDLPNGVLATVFASRDNGSLVIHLVNAAGTVDAAPEKGVNHLDEIPYPQHPDRRVTLTVTLANDWATRTFREARAYHLNTTDGVFLETNAEGRRLVVSYPLGQLRDYALIELAFD